MAKTNGSPGVHPGRCGEGERRHHACWSASTDDAAGVQHICEQATGLAENATERIRDRAEDEPPCRELGEIGNERRDEVAEIELARFHELADGVLRRLEGADEALADIAADLPCLAGLVAQRSG